MITTGVAIGAMALTTATVKLAEAMIKLAVVWRKARKEAERRQNEGK